MNEQTAPESKKRRSWIVLLLIVLLLCGAAFAYTMTRQPAVVEEEENKGLAVEDFKLGYASKGVIVTDQTDMEKLPSSGESIGLYYKNYAYSKDGSTFDCFLGNSTSNAYDAFFAIYSDLEFKDELYVTDLIRPGEAFETLTLNHALPKGDNLVYVAITQVEEDLETIHAQTIFTMNFVV